MEDAARRQARRTNLVIFNGVVWGRDRQQRTAARTNWPPSVHKTIYSSLRLRAHTRTPLTRCLPRLILPTRCAYRPLLHQRSPSNYMRLDAARLYDTPANSNATLPPSSSIFVNYLLLYIEREREKEREKEKAERVVISDRKKALNTN